MRNLFNFIAKNYFFFLFIALETLAIILLVQNHQHQRSFFLHSGNAIAGTFYRNVHAVSSYLGLRQVNEELARENAMLLHLSPFSFLVSDTDVYLHEDTIYARRFRYMDAHVINNSVQLRNNHLTLDKGRKHGVEPDMGVITMNGVVGIVKNVSENFSSVISLLHEEMQISVRLTSHDHIGTLSWEGRDYRQASMSYIPSHVELAVGDSVVTSGFSRMFPKDIFIGTVAGFEIRQGENFFTADIDLALDFNKLGYVYVVVDLMGEELEILENE
ncbi:MAG: rod shape-determining protein MreC [Bacteroidales bacterium]